MQRYSISTLAKTNNSPLRLFREDIDLRQVPYFVINHHFARIHMDVPWEVTAHGAFLMTNCITILHFINTIVIIILLLHSFTLDMHSISMHVYRPETIYFLKYTIPRHTHIGYVWVFGNSQYRMRCIQALAVLISTMKNKIIHVYEHKSQINRTYISEK